MKRWIALFSLLALLGLAATTEAQPAAESAPSLPPKFVFKATSETTGIGLSASGSLSIEKILPDGTISGKVTLVGLRCGARDAPYTGRFDGTKITIPMPFEPAALCQKDMPPYVFTKKEGNRFEGQRQAQTSGGKPVTLKLTLDPQ